MNLSKRHTVLLDVDGNVAGCVNEHHSKSYLTIDLDQMSEVHFLSKRVAPVKLLAIQDQLNEVIKGEPENGL